jgi:adenine phosphoribosyltransferase
MKTEGTHVDLSRVVRRIPDFPRKGVLFYDVTGILVDPDAFGFCVESMVERYGRQGFDAVAAVEARGFFFAAPVAVRLGLPLILVRKPGKLPGETLSRRCTLEYGEDELFVHKSDVPPGGRILLIDDLVATGGTLRAATDLLADAGGKVTHICCVIGLPFLRFRNLLSEVQVTTLVDFDGE